MAGQRSSVKASRREVLATAGALALSAAVGPQAIAAEPAPANARPIPRTGEMLPIVGLGTAIVFDIAGDATKLAEGRQVVETLADGGGKLIDTAPGYGSAEQVVGDLVSATGLRSKLFLATKLGIKDPAASRSELEGSLARLRTDPVDLVQLWNVRDPKQDLAILRDWKAAGHCRYIGITTSRPSDLGALAEICRREQPDFVQVNYSLADREAEAQALPAARESGAAVLVNLPFGRGTLFRMVRGKALPEWAAEFDAATWGQLFLKFILSHPAVTAVIPGTTNPEHMRDNLGAARGRMPDETLRSRMIEFINAQ